jgi:hypothetical protein
MENFPRIGVLRVKSGKCSWKFSTFGFWDILNSGIVCPTNTIFQPKSSKIKAGVKGI